MAEKHTLDVHPAAAIWPLLPDDELDALAASIRELGLLEPIVTWVDDDGKAWLLDGRNRLAACERAKAKLRFVRYDGDPTAYVLARNDRRRHMTKGQRAMAAWETALVSEGYTVRSIATDADVPSSTLGHAKVIHDHAPDLIGPVIAGARPLKDAYDEARKRRDDADNAQGRLDRLPADLADQVREDTLALKEAEAAAAARERELVEQRRDARSLFTRAADLIAPAQASPDFVEHWARQMGEVEPELVERIDQTIDVLIDLRKRVTQ